MSGMADPASAAGVAARRGPGDLNWRLAWRLTLRSLRRHGVVALATVLGVAIGMTVVGAILVVDANTDHSFGEVAAATADAEPGRGGTAQAEVLPFDTVSFVRADSGERRTIRIIPSQEGALKEGIRDFAAVDRRGAEDYQAMRLAVRLASLFAFFIGAIIVFYTMRYSVASRSREFCLLMCLGESRAGVALSLATEAAVLGVAGAVCGIALALPIAQGLLAAGISTNGRHPLPGFEVPWGELAAMGLIGVAVALLGVAAPVRAVRRMPIAQVLQPRFLGDDVGSREFAGGGLAWLIPALLAATYVAVRPLLQSWLSVVGFFVFEATFAVALTIGVLWWANPLLRAIIRLCEALTRRLLPLETLLTGRRMRLASRKTVVAVAGASLVFGLLTGLHTVTRALKDESRTWAWEAVIPYSFFERRPGFRFNEALFQQIVRNQGVQFFRLSAKIAGEFPVRLIRAEDVNPYREAQGRPTLRPGTAIFSRTLAARFDVSPGDAVVLRSGGADHRFEVIEVSDDMGYDGEEGQYVDLKSYVLFSDGNPIFADNLEKTLGRYGMARRMDGGWGLTTDQRAAFFPVYEATKQGVALAYWQITEIDRDFLIFDFILAMTMVLAAIGVANTMLIQVHARGREFSVMRTVGVSRWQVARLLMLEGLIIGLVSAIIAVVLGNALGAISVAFLDRFTLFAYDFRFSPLMTAAISVLAVLTCIVAAVYPAVAATRTSSAESLHYE